MLPNCLKCRKNTKIKNPKIVRTKNEILILLLNVKCVIIKNRNLSKSKKLVYH